MLTRSGAPNARLFAFLAATIVSWSLGVIVQRLSISPDAIGFGGDLEQVAAAVALPATAQFSIAIAREGRTSRRDLPAMAVLYAVNVVFAIPYLVDPGHRVAIAEPFFTLGPVPGPVFGWTWILVRLATILVAAGVLLMAFRSTRRDHPRRRQLGLTLATVGVGATGALIRLFSVVGATDPWIGVSLVTLAIVLAAAVVFSSGIFFAPDVADRAFWTSLALGLGLFLLVGLLVAVDAAGRRVLGLDVPLLTILALVVTVAVYEPVLGWARSRLRGRSPADLARERLLVALGQPGLATQAADAGVGPALARVVSTLDLEGAVVVRPDGSVAAAEGRAPDPGTAPRYALVARNEIVGELRIGPARSGGPLGAGDEGLLRLSAEYLAGAMRTGRLEDEQAEALTGLSRERADVASSATSLHEALVRRSTGPSGLRVFALGPLRVERDGEPIERWGGEKAGSRQAEALFAFLFDRGERGLAKDEALELLWPDIDVERGDLAFHRTLGGLRRTLDPARGDGRRTIRFHNDRYRLDPTIVDWSDVSAFLGRLDQARAAADDRAEIALLEEARALYRGEYLDDCPFYGDGVYVEDRRASLRARWVDLLVALGERYEADGDRASAGAAFRDAIEAAQDDCPAAEAGLARMARLVDREEREERATGA